MQLSQKHTDLLCTLSGWPLWETWQTMNPTRGAFTREVGIATTTTKTQIDYQNEAKHLSYLFAHVQQLKHFVLQLFVGFVDVASAAVDVVVAVCIVPILQEYLLSNTIGTIVCSCCAAVNVCCCYHCHSCSVAVAISVVVETVTLSEVKCRNVAIIRI